MKLNMIDRHLASRILMILLLILFLVLAVVVILEIKGRSPATTYEPPQSTPTPIPTLLPPASRWATDSAVLAIENDLRTLSLDLKNVDLKEVGLWPPVLDMEVKF